MCLIFVVIHAPSSFPAVLIIWSTVISAWRKRGSITNVTYLCCNPYAVMLYDHPHRLERGHRCLATKEAASPTCLICVVIHVAEAAVATLRIQPLLHHARQAATPTCPTVMVIHAPPSFAAHVITWSAVHQHIAKDRQRGKQRGRTTNVPYFCCNTYAVKLYGRRHHLERASSAHCEIRQ
jgi:hypothetical protein